MTGSIRGPEAKGEAALVATPEGGTVLRITDLHVVPGAPDVRLFVAPAGDVNRPDAVDLGPIASFDGPRDFALPDPLPTEGLVVVIYCKVFSVEFGRAALA